MPLLLCASFALVQANDAPHVIVNSGVSGIWVLANISYAGMRAQNSRDRFWRTMAFVFGLPGTIVTLLAVGEGSNRAYGVDLPGRSKP